MDAEPLQAAGVVGGAVVGGAVVGGVVAVPVTVNVSLGRTAVQPAESLMEIV